jgi:hypothetical protein
MKILKNKGEIMIKLFLKTILVLSVASLFAGCGSSNKPELPKAKKVGENTFVNPELQGAPKWVLMPQVKGYVAEMGSAPANMGNDISFQREEAMADARSNIARQIETKVNTMFKSYKGVTGGGKDATFDKSSESVSKQLASQTLEGTVVKDTWISKSNTLYILMIVDTKEVISMMEDAMNTSFKNNKAMYQKFLASKAQNELSDELEKLDR